MDLQVRRTGTADGPDGHGHLYEGPATLSTSGANVFRPVAPVDLWATDAAFSPDGRQLAVRGYFGGVYYGFDGGRIKREGTLDVPLQGQGESVSYSVDGTKLMYGSEGAGSAVRAEDAPARPDGKSPSGNSGSGAAADEGGPRLKVDPVILVAGAAVLFGLRRPRRR